MTTAIVPNDYRVHVGLELINNISLSPETTYYMFLGNHMPVTGGIASVADDTSDTLIAAYRNMICAKRVAATDASMMIRNIPWVANTAYAMYDDLDTSQDTDNYFAVVNAGAFSHVWKVLDNNMGANSTVVPDISQIDVSDVSYRTADGYLWKYMASSTSAQVTKFATDLFFPITANSQVISAAVPGAVDMVIIDNPGMGYNNWLAGTWAAGDIRSNGNTVTYAVTGNTTSSSVNGFYTGCNLYVAGGTGIGQFKTITDYFSNANGNFLIVDSPFDVPPQNGSQYQIYPGVVITGSGRQSLNAHARALVNAVGNTIYRVDMLTRGSGYDYLTASITANAVAAPLQAARIRPIYGPFDGHGFDAYGELGATQVSISVTFANSESNTIPASNQYQQLGILKDPLFANVVLHFSSQVGTFLGNEQVVSYSGRLLQNNVVLVSGNLTVSSANAIFSSQLSSGDHVVFVSGDATAYWYTNINVVTNSSSMSISSPPPWACTTSQMLLATVLPGQGIVSSLPGSNSIGISNVSGDFGTGSFVIGTNSGARGVTNNVSRNDITKDFITFIPMQKTIATLVSGTFQPNEVVFMGSSVNSATSTAALHSVINNAGTLTLLTSNNVGLFTEDVSQQIKGANSGAVATITTKYSSEILFGSSKVLYLENISPVIRSGNTSDIINVILSF